MANHSTLFCGYNQLLFWNVCLLPSDITMVPTHVYEEPYARPKLAIVSPIILNPNRNRIERAVEKARCEEEYLRGKTLWNMHSLCIPTIMRLI